MKYKTKNPEIDILRSIACLMIVFMHLSEYVDVIYLIPFSGTFGLGLFFFLSGFTIHLNNNIYNLTDSFRFLKKRIVRVYPLYWVALIVFLVFFQILKIKYVLNLNSLGMLIHFIGAQIILSPEYVSPVFTLWFISLILVYYSLYPIIILLSKNNRKKIVLISLVLLSFFIALRYFFNIIETRFFIYYGIFIGGIIASKSNTFLSNLYNKYFIFLSIIILTISLIIFHKLFPLHSLNPNHTIIEEITGILLLNIIMFFFVFSAFSLVKLFAKLFEKINFFFYSFAFSSYSIYLFHVPFLAILQKFFMGTLQIGKIYNEIIFISFGLPALFIISYYIQLTVNKIIEHKRVKLYFGI